MTQQKYEYNTIEEALEELRAGHMIIVSDDPDRENEGDLICAAQFCTTENMNFMASHGKGLICMPVSREYARKLNLPPMVAQNTDNHETAFTVSIDHVDTTTGISAVERAYTARKLVDENTRPEDFRRPGHMFPLIAKKGGVLTRNGHTEATVDLMRLAGVWSKPACAVKLWPMTVLCCGLPVYGKWLKNTVSSLLLLKIYKTIAAVMISMSFVKQKPRCPQNTAIFVFTVTSTI